MASSHPVGYDAVFKILLIGDSGVGKTCLMFRFTDDSFSESFVATIGIDFKMKTVTTKNNQSVRLQLWDTAGQEKFFTITRPYYRNANCVLLIYDVTKASSFENVKRWMSNIDSHAPEGVMRVLVANKCDLTEQRVVKQTEGERLAADYAVQYFETSAKTSENVPQMFAYITECLMDLKKIQGDCQFGQNSDKINLNHSTKNPLELNRLKDSISTCCSM